MNPLSTDAVYIRELKYKTTIKMRIFMFFISLGLYFRSMYTKRQDLFSLKLDVELKDLKILKLYLENVSILWDSSQ